MAALVSVLEVQVRFADDPYAKVELLHRIARLYEESLGDPSNAFETYARAVAGDSQNEESLASLERLANLIERWPAVAQLYDAELAKLGDQPERFVELGLRVAQVYEVQLENVDQRGRALPQRARGRSGEPERRPGSRSPLQPDRALARSRRCAPARG